MLPASEASNRKFNNSQNKMKFQMGILLMCIAMATPTGHKQGTASTQDVEDTDHLSGRSKESIDYDVILDDIDTAATVSQSEEGIFSDDNIPCPVDCKCETILNIFLNSLQAIATCNSLNADNLTFHSYITDLIVNCNQPANDHHLSIEADFFLKIGLKRLNSIEISNCSIEHFDSKAFNGVDNLFSINLTNVRLANLNSNQFFRSNNLISLTISGSDLGKLSRSESANIVKSFSLKELDLSRNNLTTLSEKTFQQIPLIVYLNLRSNRFVNLPDQIFATMLLLEELDLSYNSLETVPLSLRKCISLSALNLSHNRLTDGIRLSTKKLMELDLSYNLLTEIHKELFGEMRQLNNLNLKGNRIVKLQSNSFMALKSLNYIDLSGNQFDCISSNLFYNNTKLVEILLGNNSNLSHLPSSGFVSAMRYFNVYLLDISDCSIGTTLAAATGTFRTMPNLAKLNLAHNRITTLNKNIFAYQTQLNELDLSCNSIGEFDDQTFVRNREIKKLSLSQNPLHNLSPRLLMPIHHLRHLDLSNCQLGNNFFSRLTANCELHKFCETLTNLNVSSNRIGNVFVDDLKYFRNLENLDITQNPLECNEEFHRFIDYANATVNNGKSLRLSLNPNVNWIDLKRTICDLNPHNDGKTVKVLKTIATKLNETKGNQENANAIDSHLNQTNQMMTMITNFDGKKSRNDGSQYVIPFVVVIFLVCIALLLDIKRYILIIRKRHREHVVYQRLLKGLQPEKHAA